ncbi:hypothetical protein F7725_026554 [Dissostichus mawsoni]|uniref:Uncharacterized protein n=1 Tax=Dissostichus mawsoni TaxID=36200 RepID=A0A7J5X8A1_DISMA|nr:hypothetical protein F7725_026554 [Dissostichus mawsoni]
MKLQVPSAVAPDTWGQAVPSAGHSGPGHGVLDGPVSQPACIAPVQALLPGLEELGEGGQCGGLLLTGLLGCQEAEVVVTTRVLPSSSIRRVMRSCHSQGTTRTRPGVGLSLLIKSGKLRVPSEGIDAPRAPTSSMRSVQALRHTTGMMRMYWATIGGSKRLVPVSRACLCQVAGVSSEAIVTDADERILSYPCHARSSIETNIHLTEVT